MNTALRIHIASTFSGAPLEPSLQGSLRAAEIAEELSTIQFTQMSEYLVAFSQDSSQIRATLVLLRLEDWLREYLKSAAADSARIREELRLRVEEFVSQLAILAHLGKPVWFLACPSTGWVAHHYNVAALCRTFLNLVTARVRGIPEVTVLNWPLPASGYEDRDADAASQVPFTADAFRLLGESLGPQLARTLAGSAPAAPSTSGSPELAAYLAGLQVRVSLAPAGPAARADVERLLRSVVAFSLTGEKPTVSASEVDAVLSAEGCLLVGVADRISDYGPSGLVVYRSAEGRLIVESLALSCTVLGKQVEYAILSALGAIASGRGCTAIAFQFHPTGRNQAILAFLRQIADSKSDTCYVLDPAAIPDRIAQSAANPGAWTLSHSET